MGGRRDGVVGVPGQKWITGIKQVTGNDGWQEGKGYVTQHPLKLLNIRKGIVPSLAL